MSPRRAGWALLRCRPTHSRTTSAAPSAEWTSSLEGVVSRAIAPKLPGIIDRCCSGADRSRATRPFVFPTAPWAVSTLEVVMTPRIHVLVFLGRLASLSAGCSISKSSETISDSLTSPFRWSSDSSPDGGDHFAYSRDLSDYAASFAKSGGDLDAFRTAVRLRAEAE